MSCAPRPGPEAESVRVTLTGYTLAQLPGRQPRSAVQLPVPVGVVSPSTGMVTCVTPWASVLKPDSAMAGDCAAHRAQAAAAQCLVEGRAGREGLVHGERELQRRAAARCSGSAAPW